MRAESKTSKSAVGMRIGSGAGNGWAFVLSLLALVFVGRVTVQLIQWVSPVGLLPEFDRWQSGALPYPALLISQLLIIVAMVVTTAKLSRNGLRLRTRTAYVVRAIGLGYVALMLLRLVAGLTFADGHSWWDARLPTMFHLVLASFILVASFAGAPSEGSST